MIDRTKKYSFAISLIAPFWNNVEFFEIASWITFDSNISEELAFMYIVHVAAQAVGKCVSGIFFISFAVLPEKTVIDWCTKCSLSSCCLLSINHANPQNTAHIYTVALNGVSVEGLRLWTSQTVNMSNPIVVCTWRRWKLKKKSPQNLWKIHIATWYPIACSVNFWPSERRTKPKNRDYIQWEKQTMKMLSPYTNTYKRTTAALFVGKR